MKLEIKIFENEGKFKGVNSEYERANSLKNKCNEAYKTSKSDFSTNNTSKFDKVDVMKYCSLFSS